ncbi:MAG: formylglycine-generating enzyme family protein [Cohaesibacter sp.]|jgi:formylglycine-generating enzyme required for sulfatase activity|nr:formylglycine-generating enzyme family protein [Cohaesibacter sp.]
MNTANTRSLIQQGLIGASILSLLMLGQLLVHMRAFASNLDIETVLVEPSRLIYRLPGEYLKDDLPSAAPVEERTTRTRLHVMKYQVTVQDYERCVEEGQCKPQWQAYSRADGSADEGSTILPVTGVSYDDAVTYAKWLSAKTGQNWRLPTDLEWAGFAAERYYDDATRASRAKEPSTMARPAASPWNALKPGDLPSDSDYDPLPKIPGHFGLNSNGIADLSGNIWEWTSSCFMSYRHDSKNGKTKSHGNCGVFIAQGKQRSYLSSFLQDPLSGACAVGEPPENLGIRLVREEPKTDIKSRLSAFLAR